MTLRPRRPFTVLTALGTAAHHAFEVRAGVGLVFEPFIGRRGAVAMWAGALPAWALAGWTGEGERLEKWIALNNAAGLAGGIVHFAEWPWELRNGIPYLTEAEGLTPEQLPAYNRVLHLWTLAGPPGCRTGDPAPRAQVGATGPAARRAPAPLGRPSLPLGARAGRARP